MRLARIFSEVLAGAAIGISVLFALAQWNVFGRAHLSGATYLPPSWIAAVALPAALGCLLLKRRGTAFAVIGTLLGLVVPFSDFSLDSRSMSATGMEAPGTRRLSVVALNVQYYSFGIEAVARALKETGADVALLSENVLQPEDVERARQAFAPGDFRMGRSGETAIISHLPIVHFDEVELPTSQASLSGPNRLDEIGARPRRSFIHAVVDHHGVPINLLSVRLIAGRAPKGDLLSQARWGFYLFDSQVAETDFLKQYLAQIKGPYIFGGDLNAPPSASVIRGFRDVADDAYLANHLLGKPTFRVRAPLLRLDYLFSSKDVSCVDSRRVDVEVSDHFPVYAEFRVPGRAKNGTAAAESSPR